MENLATIGIFGGSGFYSFLNNAKEVTIETPCQGMAETIQLRPKMLIIGQTCGL